MNSNPIHVKLNNLGKWSLGSAHYTFIHIQMIFHMSNVVNISKSQIDQGRCLNFFESFTISCQTNHQCFPEPDYSHYLNLTSASDCYKSWKEANPALYGRIKKLKQEEEKQDQGV